MSVMEGTKKSSKGIIIVSVLLGIAIAVIIYLLLNPKKETITVTNTHTDTIVEFYPQIEWRDSVRTIEKIKEIFNHDTVYFTHTDTVQFIEDWSTIRTYNVSLYDIPAYGKCDVTVTVHLNRLDTLTYSIQQYQSSSKLEPVVSTSAFTLDKSIYLSLGAGLQYNHIQVQAFGLTNGKSVGLGIQATYKF